MTDTWEIRFQKRLHLCQVAKKTCQTFLYFKMWPGSRLLVEYLFQPTFYLKVLVEIIDYGFTNQVGHLSSLNICVADSFNRAMSGYTSETQIVDLVDIEVTGLLKKSFKWLLHCWLDHFAISLFLK